MTEPRLQKAIDDWRRRHNLAPEDPILLVGELLQLYIDQLPVPPRGGSGTNNRRPEGGRETFGTWWLASLALLIAALGGYLLGRAL